VASIATERHTCPAQENKHRSLRRHDLNLPWADTGLRDLEVPQALTRHLGHSDCGIYAEVVKGGEIAQGDTIEIT
jgi:hypothetical protein